MAEIGEYAFLSPAKQSTVLIDDCIRTITTAVTQMNKKKNYIIMTKNSSYATTQVIMDNCKTQFNHSLVYLSIT